jgi:hypothetical protein
MASKKKTTSNQGKDKNTLYDPFLDRSIALTPNTDEILGQEAPKSKSENQIQIKQSNSTSPGKPKLNLKKLSQTPSPALISSNASELSAEIQPQDDSTKNTQFSSRAQSGKTSLWGTINSDIVWFAIALASILGVLLFYFQGLQPLILGKYVDQTQNRIIELNQSYTEKVTNYLNLRSSLTAQVGYNPAGTCQDEPLYKSLQNDTSQLDLLRVGLLADTSFKELPKYQVFYERQIQNQYDTVYQSYSDTLSQIRNTSGDIYSLPGFLDYRNIWISSCQKISNSKGDLTILKNVCAELKTKTQNYQQTNLPGYSDFKAKVDAGINKCTDPESAKTSVFSGYGQWFLDWLNKYSAIMSFKPAENNQVQPINDLNQKFTSQLKLGQQKINEIYDSRLSFWNIWYLMNF